MNGLRENIAVVHLLDPQSINDTDTVSNILDLAGFDGAVIAVSMGEFTGVDADSTLLPVLQESDSIANSSFTTVAATDIHGAFTLVNSTSKDQTTQYVGYHGAKRYIRAKLDFTTGSGGITAALVGVVGIVGGAGVLPVTAGPDPITAT